MALTLQERRAVIKETAGRYQRARKREKTKILDEFVVLTGYTRHHACWVLRTWGKRSPPKHTRRRRRIYDHKVFVALREVWLICDSICGKRLAPYLKEIVPILIRHKELTVNTETAEKLTRISAATIDRLLAQERKKYNTKPRLRSESSLLNRIPLKTFSEWDRTKPGHLQVDLVEHNGGTTRGEYACSLVMTDPCSGWTEVRAVRNKAQVWVFEALQYSLGRIPFQVDGLHSDGGSEFINDHLEKYCEKEGITFTHSRPYKKNDNFCVEQKNGNIVRRAVGYGRYSGESALKVLNELYEVLKVYVNYFQPVMKLVEKTRIGSRVTKRYDKARTPFKQLLECEQIEKEAKQVLSEQYRSLNPAELKRKITCYQQQLFRYLPRRRTRDKSGLDSVKIYSASVILRSGRI